MAKYKHRLKAREFRKRGESIKEIAKKIGVSKSTVSLWCNDIKLSRKHEKNLAKRKLDGMSMGRLMGAKARRDKKLSLVKLAFQEAKEEINSLSRRDILIAGASLYWAEGSKSESTFGFMFINSDPKMIFFMKKFLNNIFHINDKDIACTIQINKIHKRRIKKVLNFWSDLLQLPISQFNKPSYIKIKPKKIYENHESYFGILRLRVRKSANLKYKILGLIEALKSVNLSG
ncbi:helix-turn-helix domain-containing protein [Candidatus Peregrinibacteria bacterium]|nr:helix-turn-helix domain-containing protein [Candidatus Peregrinibacteria bacterium]